MKQPHIIIINPDEMRADSIGHLSAPVPVTPHLDTFAQNEAVSFSNAFCQNPVCVPSRCSFFTGLYPHVHGHRTMTHLLHEHESSLFSELKNAGYYVWMNSRNDLIAGQIDGLDEKHADEVYYYDKTKPAPPMPIPDPSRLAAMGRGKQNPFPYLHFKGAGPEYKNIDLEDTLAACDRILHPVQSEKPLCLFLGWTNPHPPYMVPQEYRDRVNAAALAPRIKYSETQNKSRIIGSLRELTDGCNFPEEQWTELRAVYQAQCAMVDDMFGMVCNALKQAGIYDDSTIFFLSDHGDFCGDYDLPEKAQNTFEHCLTRVPLLIKPPKGCTVDAGISASLTELVDFYATVMDYAGVQPDHTHFGKSLRPVIENRGEKIRRYVFCEGGRNAGEEHCDEWHSIGPEGPMPSNDYWARRTAQKEDAAHTKGTMIFDGRYKYIHRAAGPDEFYDLVRDPGERINCIENADSLKLAGLRSAMMDWYQQTNDVVPFRFDSRFTAERIWTAVRAFVPPEEEDHYRAAIEGKEIMEAIQICIRMRMASAKRESTTT